MQPPLRGPGATPVKVPGAATTEGARHFLVRAECHGTALALGPDQLGT